MTRMRLFLGCRFKPTSREMNSEIRLFFGCGFKPTPKDMYPGADLNPPPDHNSTATSLRLAMISQGAL
jgi:hypothetical protein